MAKLRLPRLIFIGLACTVLAIVLAMQALSSVATRKAPAQAVSLNPYNGLAQEQLAIKQFGSLSGEGLSNEEAARSSLPSARQGLQNDPLAPKSYALLILAEEAPEKRRALTIAANQLNRRDQLLQRLVLQEHIDTIDREGVVTTLDQLLRAHPETYDEFFPLLAETLKVDEAAPLFPVILNGDAPWHLEFLRFAARDNDALSNLAAIHSDIVIRDEPFDSLLIRGLAEQGDLAAALSIYENVRDPRPDNVPAGELSWAAKFPPIDWSLAEQSDFRAQVSRDGRALELYARSGQGGTFARRILATPQVPFHISSALTMRTSGRSDNVRLTLRCIGQQTRFFDEAFDTGDNQWTIADLPDECAQLMIEVNGRALRAEPTLRAEISQISIETR